MSSTSGSARTDTAKINYYVYQLIMPRTTFAHDMTPAEAAIMSRHVEYWRGLMGHGRVVAFGPVLDSAGSWGLALVAGASSPEVARLGDADPAVTSGLATYRVHEMPGAVIHRDSA